jgi:phosphopantothenoylcysteine decarboxylase/phosphopantothenate--cysteine ligase
MPTVVWGLSSSVAIYKAVEAIRLLTKDGSVRVLAILSARAEDFIRPLLIEALTHAPVYRAHEVMTPDHQILHTALAREADLMVLAPATAHLLARLAHGIADDLLTSTVLAYDGRVVVAPAMNVHMWRNPATQQNVTLLAQRGFVLVGPVEGPQAEGDVGMGRLVEPAELVEVVRTYLDQRRSLAGQTVLVTAGPTQEPLDTVRFISNPSSGKMGFALAEAALQRGAHVILVSGPVHLIPHPAMEFYPVRTAQEMADTVLAHADRADWVVKAAAVADYRPSEVLPYKRKKASGPWTVRLEPTVDILEALGRRKLHTPYARFSDPVPPRCSVSGPRRRPRPVRGRIPPAGTEPSDRLRRERTLGSRMGPRDGTGPGGILCVHAPGRGVGLETAQRTTDGLDADGNPYRRYVELEGAGRICYNIHRPQGKREFPEFAVGL